MEDNAEHRQPMPSRKVANAVCVACSSFIKIDPDAATASCPLCGKVLDVHQATMYYDHLLQLEEKEVAEAVGGMTDWHYYSGKFKYYLSGSLPIHAVCIPVMAIAVLVYQFAGQSNDLPAVYFAGAIAVVVEAVWLFWLIMPVTMAGMHEDIARHELFGTRVQTRFKKLQIALVVVGVATIAGCFAFNAATAPPTEEKPHGKSPEEILRGMRGESQEGADRKMRESVTRMLQEKGIDKPAVPTFEPEPDEQQPDSTEDED